MARKFIIDSVCFWAQEYRLGGFRFDLMGVHDIETMNLLAEAVKKVDDRIVLYGEPWCGGSCALPFARQAVQVNANQLKGVGQFNDQMRDALIKSGMNSAASKGWVTDAVTVDKENVRKIVAGLQGITLGEARISDPNRTVNYVTCHDNYTLYDRIKAAGIAHEATARKMAMLANAVVLTSNGTCFLLAGEEFLRSKGGDHNSYRSSYAVNELNYGLKIRHRELLQHYQALIAFKKTMAALHLEETRMPEYRVESFSGGTVLRISFHDMASRRDYVIHHANGAVRGFRVNLAGFCLALDTLGNTALTASTTLRPYQTLIAYRETV